MGRFLIVFEEIPDRDAAEAARGMLLEVDAASVTSPEDPDEFLDHELIGLQVVRDDGEAVGTLVRVDHGLAHDMLIVLLGDGREALVPFVKAIVPTVDVANGRIVIDPPGGLLEL
jgi:16S rRNA processing protein RimM